MKNLFIAAILVFGFSFSSIAGGKETKKSSIINGKVVDSKQEVVAGALIIIEATGEKVYSDLEGNFSIENATGENIQVSFISFNDKVIKIEDTTKEITVVLEEK